MIRGKQHKKEVEEKTMSAIHVKHQGKRLSSRERTDLCLAEALLLVALSSVGKEDSALGLHSDVVLKTDVLDLDVIVGPVTHNISPRKQFPLS